MKRMMICLSVFCLVVLFQSFASQTGLATRDQANTAHQISKRSKSATNNSKLVSRRAPSNPAPSQIGFLSAPQIQAGGADYSIYPAVLGNFSGAGKPQSAAMLVDTGTTTPAINISVALSNGDGTFTTALTSLGTTVTSESNPIFVGDVNGDGFDDIVVLTVAAPATMSVWLNNADGSGTFTLKSSATVTTNAAVGGALTVVKPDTNLDFVVADLANPGNIWTLKGNGDGTFGSPSAVPFTGQLSQYSTVVFADFNGDGFLDFAGASGSSTNLYQVDVYLNNGSNSGYLAPIGLTTPNGRFESCFNLAGNLSGHAGQADIVVANCDNGVAGRASNVLVYVNNGNGTGTFANGNLGVPYSGGSWPTGLTIADMNGDGKNDLVITDQEGGGVAVLLGNGDGTLQGNPVLVSYAVGGGPRRALPPLVTDYNPAVVADFNGDGHPDVMLPNFLTGFVYLQGYGDGTFRSAVNYYAEVPSANQFPTSVAIASGDFNGDGIPDFVIGNANGNGIAGGITVFLSNADGSLQPGVTYLGTSATGQLTYVAVADFNGDGKLDIAATDAINGGVQIFTGNGDGTFTAGAPIPSDTVTATTQGIVAADFDGDGKPDLAVVNTTNSGANGDIGVLINSGSGFKPVVNYPLTAPALTLTSADLGNKQLNLVVPIFGTSSTAGNTVAIFLGKGDGTFTAGTPVVLSNGTQGTFYAPFSAAIGDMNNDGKPDLVVSTDDHVHGSLNQGIVVALGNGDGTFQTPNLYSSSAQSQPNPMEVQLVDLNRDGNQDVITANYKSGTVALLYGKGDGTLYDPIEYVPTLEPLGVALADVNGDGAIDVISSGDGNGFSGVNVLLNSSADTTVASSSANPSVAGVPVTFNATVSGSKVRGVTAVPTGTVTFFDGTTALGAPIPLNSDAASLSVSLTAGSHSITAQYNGDLNYLVSTSAVIPQVVNTSTSSTVLKSSSNPAAVGSAVTFSANVASTVSGDTLVPTGTVTFLAGSTKLGSGTLNSSGQASFSTSSLAAGTYSITAQYAGDTNFAASTSAALNQVIGSPVQPNYTLSTPGSQTVNPGSAASYSVTLTPANGYDGTVTFACPTSLPPGVTCTLPSPTVPAGQAVTITLNTTGPSARLFAPAGSNPHPSGMNFLASLGSIGVFGLLLTGDSKRRKARRLAIVLGVLAIVMILALGGCGGGSSSSGGGGGTGGTPAGNYTVNVTATGTAGTNGGNTSAHPLSLTLNVN